MLKFSYSTSSETLLALLTDVIYQISAEYDKDSHDSMFESWKTAFVIRRLAQSEKLQALQSWCWIEEIKDSIIKKKVKVVLKDQQDFNSLKKIIIRVKNSLRSWHSSAQKSI